MKTIILILMLLSLSIPTLAKEYTNEEIANAIFFAEGGYKTSYPYGIKSVYCEGIENCKQICLNTIANNKIRYKEYGYKKHNTYLEFLASRYCPASISGCENWLPNVTYFLERNK